MPHGRGRSGVLIRAVLAAALAVAPAAAPATAAPDVRCTVSDARLVELSGLVVDGDALWATADGGRRVELLRLDPSTCEVTDVRTAAINPYDAEDLARGPGGALWVADVGDNGRDRDTVAVVVVPDRGRPQLHRLTYPDGPHDAEALLVDPDGRPVVITKEVGSTAGVYRTAAAPDGAGPTPLERVGQVVLPSSDTAGGPLGGLGSRTVTGAAASADGRVVALRTYTDAWLYPAPDGDPVAALAGDPVRVPLPDEPQGEALAFGPDGTLYSASEGRGGRRGELRAVPGAVQLAATGRPVAPATADEGRSAGAPDGSADPAPPTWQPAAIGAGAVVGALVVLTAALGLRGRRR